MGLHFPFTVDQPRHVGFLMFYQNQKNLLIPWENSCVTAETHADKNNVKYKL